jgi:hypothetical protein
MLTKKFRFLSFALIFSGSLNVALIALLSFYMFEKTSLPMAIMGKKEVLVTKSQIFNSMSRLKFRELVSFLTNKELIEEGYTKRDLAVAALVAYHHFNLEKALVAKPEQVRTLVFANGQTLDVFPGLSEEQFDAIIRFAYQEKWPLTAKGLFQILQSQKPPREESLEQAFALTAEFHALQVLFQKTRSPQETAMLIDLASQGSWELLDGYLKEQAKVVELSEEKRRALLLEFLKHHSPTAANLLLKTDFSYALKKLDDKQTLDLLVLLKKQSEESTKFCIELLKSPRSDAIWQAAALTLYSYVGEMPALPIDPPTVLARFCPAKEPAVVVEKKQPAEVAVSKYHVVKEGESLWKISRQYKVKVDEIVKLNDLEKDSLYPGMTLKLP